MILFLNTIMQLKVQESVARDLVRAVRNGGCKGEVLCSVVLHFSLLLALFHLA